MDAGGAETGTMTSAASSRRRRKVFSEFSTSPRGQGPTTRQRSRQSAGLLGRRVAVRIRLPRIVCALIVRWPRTRWRRDTAEIGFYEPARSESRRRSDPANP
jgi:hypothetical protein